MIQRVGLISKGLTADGRNHAIDARVLETGNEIRLNPACQGSHGSSRESVSSCLSASVKTETVYAKETMLNLHAANACLTGFCRLGSDLSSDIT